MTNTETYQITVQPWTNRLVSVGFSVATYTSSGRQKWERRSNVYCEVNQVYEEILKAATLALKETRRWYESRPAGSSSSTSAEG